MTNLTKCSTRCLSLIVLFLLVAGSSAFAQTTAEQIDQLIKVYQENGQFNGSALVAHEGKVVHKAGYGWANVEWDIPNAPDTKHRLGSITKQFTAMLILQLAEEGLLDLEAPITTYLPDYPKENGDRITTHQLLAHTSGTPNYTAMGDFFDEMSRDPYTPEEFVPIFADKELDFEPGSQFSYSNSGYFLLGVIIEKLTNMTYEEALHHMILEPAGMNNTGYDNHAPILKNRATGYERQGGQLVNSPYLDMSLPYAAGSMYSTAEDLFLWDQILYTNRLLSEAYMELYYKPAVKAWGPMHYAYGWTVGKEAIGNTPDSVYTISHGGGINGFNTIISRTPSDKSVVVLLSNAGGAPLSDMAQSIRAILAGTTFDLPKKSLVREMVAVAEAEGNEAGIAFFQQHKNDEDYDLDEGDMNNLGYQLMGAGDVATAATVFKLNMDAFPNS
ncbi:MAG: serine hydrolase domain-containing protein, partial [Bacteroidota bacterium]